ncbi:hypothetical protein [Streptomyces sp. NPDC051657]|uniref:hypothetical protein n=1 Tax=unclassified Streptomyces TaxID=2593676 RepID=UPI00343B4F47
MISARIRYTLTLCLAVASAAVAIAAWAGGAWPIGLAFWLLNNACVVACGRMQKTAALLQQAHHAARVAALQAELLDGQHCGERKPPWSKVPELVELTECVLRPGHPGSHADETGTRWWWIDADAPPSARAQRW